MIVELRSKISQTFFTTASPSFCHIWVVQPVGRLGRSGYGWRTFLCGANTCRQLPAADSPQLPVRTAAMRRDRGWCFLKNFLQLTWNKYIHSPKCKECSVCSLSSFCYSSGRHYHRGVLFFFHVRCSVLLNRKTCLRGTVGRETPWRRQEIYLLSELWVILTCSGIVAVPFPHNHFRYDCAQLHAVVWSNTRRCWYRRQRWRRGLCLRGEEW